MSVPSQEASRSRSWYRETPVAPGVFEFFLTFRVFRPEPRDFETMEKETKRRFSGVTEGISITVFRPSSGTSSDDFVASVSEYAPVVTIGGRGWRYFSFVATGYRFESDELRKASFERSSDAENGGHLTVLKTEWFVKTTLDAHRSVADTFASQADGFYRAVSNVLKSRNMVPGDFVRSWNYVDSILMRYSEFNAVRDARFAELGVVGPEYPAGTGIDCVLEGSSKMRAFAEFHSRGMKWAPKIVHYKTREQCEAPSYGPKFSRAVSVESNGFRRVHVSWTAAVGVNGETLHSDDIDQNVVHTMETVRELLSLAGADFSHIVRSHAYFKKPEFSNRFEEWARSRGMPDFPCAYNVCDVCRDDWLFEFECVAFVPVKKAGFVEFRKPSEPIGNKAEHFRTLAKSGFPVPASLAVSGEMARKLSPGSEESQNLLIAFESAFGKGYAEKRYAVRSSSRLEDSDSSSRAGAFRSVMSVSFDWLFPAIMTVKKSLDSGIGPAEYGILIQEYVPLETFGVAFTSDPEFSSHAIVAEISRGPGETLVSGKNLPDGVSFSRNVPVPSEFAHASWVDWEFWRKTFRRVESVFGKPQDIEWGVAENGDAVILQARPITTLSGSDIGLLRAFDRFESARPFGKERYRLVRNELCEPFDEPTDVELAFLRRLYRHPAIARAYASCGIRYAPRDFLVTVAKKLFIDADEERRCFEGDDSDSKLEKLLIRWKNLWRLGAVGAQVAHGGRRRLERLESDMLSALEFAVSMRESGERMEESHLLDRLYAPVFEANFLAASLRAFRRGKPSPAGVPYVPSNPERWKGMFSKTDSLGLKGNSLAWSDVSDFSTPLSEEGRFAYSDGEFSPEAALDFLREAGRTVSVICANVLRESEKTFGKTVPARAPQKLVSPFFEWKKSSRTEWEELSSGNAEGEFFLWDGKSPLPSRPLVVFVETLDPSLVDVLTDSVQAVVSRRWGRLSHFAIVARERKLPVFVGTGIKVGDFVARTVRVDETGIRASGS